MTDREFDWEAIEKVFESYGNHNPRDEATVYELVNDGWVDVETTELPSDPIDFELLDAHRKVHGNVSPGEGERHTELKIAGARFLRDEGHHMPTVTKELNGGSEQVSCFTSFEVSRTPFEADVACGCEDCTAIVEVGYTPPKRLAKAFGFLPTEETDPDSNSSHLHFSARTKAESVDLFCVVPYGASQTIWVFRPSDPLPVPDRSFVRRRAEEILDDGEPTN